LRYYDLTISGATGSQSKFHFSSLDANGVFNPGALNIEIDAEVWNQGAPNNASVVIWGIPLTPSFGYPGISQASDLNHATIKLYAGMSAGLPLAQPAQQGPVLQGQIFQAFGNWIGTAQTINLVVTADGTMQATPGSTAPGQIILAWPKGTLISVAIQQALSAYYPTGQVIKVILGQDLVATRDVLGFYDTLTEFSQTIWEYSFDAVKTPGYLGITIIPQPNGIILVTDGGSPATSSPTTLLNFFDLIGQPTWIAPNTVQFQTVLRGDLGIGAYVKFPQLQATSTAAEFGNQVNDKAAFQGTFWINYVRHVGNFRQPAAESWITTFNAVATSALQ
jgi:hypothetical protein